MPSSDSINVAADIVRDGGVIAYPTEGVFGFGCLPNNESAVRRILEIKQRDVAEGLILIGANLAQLQPWVADDVVIYGSDEKAITWIVPASPTVPAWISGRHDGVAVRITHHPIAAALCMAAESAIVSTSANVSGKRPTRNGQDLRDEFAGQVDYIVPGECGSLAGTSEIRDLLSNRTLRPAAT